MKQSNRQLALTMAVQSVASMGDKDLVIEWAKSYEAYLDENSDVGKLAVLLHSHGNSVLNTIRLVKDLTGMSFFDSKEMVAKLPAVVKNGVSHDEAVAIKNHFNWSGCRVTIEKCSSM